MSDETDFETKVDRGGEPGAPSTRFSFAQVELKWLPVSESAFLLWVLAALVGLWLLAGYLLGLI